MANDLKNLLEENNTRTENELFGGTFDVYKKTRREILIDHDTRLINFVLDLVEKEVENYIQQNRQKVERLDRYVLDELLTIINQLRV